MNVLSCFSLFAEAKESLEQELSDLNTNRESLLLENSNLQARLEKFHEMEGKAVYKLRISIRYLKYLLS